MKGKKRKFLSSLCAVFLAFLMIGQTIGGHVVSSVAATTGWVCTSMIDNKSIKVDKDTYIIGQDTKVVVTFDVIKAPEAGESGDLLFEIVCYPNGVTSSSQKLTDKTVPLSDIKTGENKVEIPVEFGAEMDDVTLRISQKVGMYDYETVDKYVSFSVKKPGSVDTSGNEYTSNWILKEQVSNVKTDKATYSLGSEQSIKVSFNVAKLPEKDSLKSSNKLHFIIANSSFQPDEYLSDDMSLFGVIASQSTEISKLKCGTNTITLKTRFESKGVYYLYVLEESYYYIEGQLPKVSITVTAATDDGGNVINTKASVRPQYSVYSPKQAATMKIFYNIDDSSSKYHLYVRRGLSKNGYNKDQKYVVADFMTDQGDLPTVFGKEQSVTLKKTDKDFEKIGVYTAVLYNTTTGKQVAQQKFYVVYEKYVIQRDVTKMKDDGTIPFYCDADLLNFDLDKDENYSFQVCFPLNYKEYYQELELTFDHYGDDEDLDVGMGPRDEELEYDAFLKSDYYANMTVSYVPEYSKDASRKLFTKKITGMYTAHTITLSAKEILKKIYETNPLDAGYAGVVTVTFSNEDDHQMISNDAVKKFTESFKFGVSKAENLVSVTPDSTKVELAYGEAFRYTLKDTLGGKIVQEIYKGKEMIDTVEGFCMLQEDGTAAGRYGWDLRDINGNYAEEGEYTAKVYTVNEYTVFEKDGSTTQKKIESDKKEIKFTLVKPNRSLTLSAKVSGESGGNAVYVEKPSLSVIVKANIGVSVIISVKSSKGVEIRNSSAVCGKGQKAVSMNLSGSKLKAGKYKVVVEAETLDGQKKKATATVHVKKLPKASIQNASVSANSDTGIGTVSFKISEYADVTVLVKSGKSILQTVIDQSYSAGAIKTSFSIGGYKAGNYSVVIKTKNSGGKRTVTRSFTVKEKPVIVKKPTVSNLHISFEAGRDGDMVKGTFNYTGKGAKIIIDIMYNDTEEIVYTYQAVTKYESGTYTYTWDGFKSNGFRCWTGNYTYRVHLVNSAGSTGYLRQNFTLGNG